MSLKKQGYRRSNHMQEIKEQTMDEDETVDEVTKLRQQIKQLEADKAQISETAATYLHELEELRDKVWRREMQDKDKSGSESSSTAAKTS